MTWVAKTWLVTGCSSGFGLALARAVLARGGSVAATARDPSGMSAKLADTSGRMLVAPLDVTDADQIREVVNRAEARFGGIDVLVNCAGYGFQGGIEESSDAEIREQFETNFFGLVAVTRAVLPGMRRRGSGYIVNFSSVAGFISFAGVGWYSASKFAVEGFSEALAAEGAPLGVRVLVVEPGPFRTDFSGRSIRRPAQRIAAYETVTARHLATDQQAGNQEGDPHRAAEAILTAMDVERPPFRLLLGAMAVRTAVQAYNDRLRSAAEWTTLAQSADYPEGSPPTERSSSGYNVEMPPLTGSTAPLTQAPAREER